ncbi:MAG: hypothetical protein FWH20_04890 [Oscillospiraceae bacterium]|nr:hypothetical protein [Oscillospiraceae bacterium]
MYAKKLIALLITAAVLITLPIAATAQDDYHTPEFFNENEYRKLVSFFTQNDNNRKIFDELGWEFDDPLSWVYKGYMGVTWYNHYGTDEYRVAGFKFDGSPFSGDLDLSGFTELYVVNLSYTAIDSINLSGNTTLEYLSVTGSNITSLDISSNTELVELFIHSNKLTSIDISNNLALTAIYIDDNYISEMDLSKHRHLTGFSAARNKLRSISSLEDLELLCYVDVRDNYLDLTSPQVATSIAKVQATVDKNEDNESILHGWWMRGVEYEPQNEAAFAAAPTWTIDLQKLIAALVALIGMSAVMRLLPKL